MPAGALVAALASAQPDEGMFSATVGLPVVLIAVVALVVIAVVFFVRRRR